MLKKVFISYRRGDTSVFARLLHHELERRIGGDRVFLDREDVEPGTDFVQRIEQGIGGAGVVLALLGVRWLPTLRERLKGPAPDYVFEELKQTLQRSIPLVPLLVEGAQMPAAADLPAALAALTRQNALELTDRFFEVQAEKIVQIVRRWLGLPQSATKSPRDQQLLVAAENGNTAAVRGLIDEGVPVDARNDYDETPLILAAGGGHASALRVLLDHGADVKAINRDGVTALMAAVMGKNNPLVVKTLLEHGAEANARANDGSTALFYAADKGDPNTVILLLEHGADPNLGNDHGVFPMARALYIKNEQNKLDVLALLMDPQKALRRYR